MDHEQLLGSIKQLLEVQIRSLNDKIETQNTDLKERIVDLKNDVKQLEIKVENKIETLNKEASIVSNKLAVAETKIKSNSSFFGAIGGALLAILTTVISRLLGF